MLPRARSPSSEVFAPLDSLAHLLASDSKDQNEIRNNLVAFRRLIQKKLRVAYQDTEELAHEAIHDFLKTVRSRPSELSLVSGKYLWGIAKNRLADSFRKTKGLVPIDEAGMDEPTIGSKPFLEATLEFSERERLLSLQLYSHQVLGRLSDRAKEALGRDILKILEVVHLCAASAGSVDAAFKEAAEELVAQNILTEYSRRNIKVRLNRRADLRRELGMPSMQSPVLVNGLSQELSRPQLLSTSEERNSSNEE